ncbi:hypothetical protein T10_6078 [Trichinella papuae]|uniref:Uncharacterized protein n=1 Tax=Trichinella papuae TaxID=268474 RepID=A0A0V1MFW5_9BILA|nr:hypothetical protein T10_6078 [Trichinella papuae]
MAEYGRERRNVARGLVFGQMSSSKRIGGQKVDPDGDVPDANNKAEAEPPTVTGNPLQFVKHEESSNTV